MRVLVINGHPRKESLSAAITEQYAQGARDAGMDVHVIHVRELEFNPNVIHPSPNQQFQEPGILFAQECIRNADHLVFVYPTWWGTMPAMLKGFIDRVFTSGFAFEEIEGGTGYLPLLTGRTAAIITTMDTPAFVYKYIYHSPGHHALGTATLGFCGFKMGKILRLGMVRYSTLEKRETWLRQAYAAGYALKKGVFSPGKKIRHHLLAWIKAIRLQFYPMTFVAYLAGAYGAYRSGFGFDRTVFWLGYLWLFFTEMATVFSNEYFDYRTDKENRLFSPFNGGSRVMVDKLIRPATMKKAIGLTVGMAALLMTLLLFSAKGDHVAIGITGLVVMVIALGYTVPPLRLSYRTLGEITVGITHSFAVIICGYIFQGGGIADGFSWWLGLPLFFAVLPSIILAGIPDQLADMQAGKKTIAVRLGVKGAAISAMIFTIIPALLLFAWDYFNILPVVFANIYYGVIPHAILLTFLLSRYIRKNEQAGRIDGLIIAALTYLVWYAAVPLANLV